MSIQSVKMSCEVNLTKSVKMWNLSKFFDQFRNKSANYPNEKKWRFRIDWTNGSPEEKKNTKSESKRKRIDRAGCQNDKLPITWNAAVETKLK